jgi:hypothetical protein
VSARDLANKLRRALRNETGTSFSLEELRQLGDMGVVDLVVERELEEMRQSWVGKNSGSTQSGHSGLPGASNRHSSRSAGTTSEQRSLAAKALVAGR